MVGWYNSTLLLSPYSSAIKIYIKPFVWLPPEFAPAFHQHFTFALKTYAVFLKCGQLYFSAEESKIFVKLKLNQWPQQHGINDPFTHRDYFDQSKNATHFKHQSKGYST